MTDLVNVRIAFADCGGDKYCVAVLAQNGDTAIGYDIWNDQPRTVPVCGLNTPDSELPVEVLNKMTNLGFNLNPDNTTFTATPELIEALER